MIMGLSRMKALLVVLSMSTCSLADWVNIGWESSPMSQESGGVERVVGPRSKVTDNRPSKPQTIIRRPRNPTHHENHPTRTKIRSVSSNAVSPLERCGGPRGDGSSVIVVEHGYRSASLTPLAEASIAEAIKWHNCTSNQAARFQPPQAAGAALFVMSAPSAGGGTLSLVLEHLAPSRAPLCGRHYAGTVLVGGRPPLSVHKHPSVTSCSRSESRLLWGSLSLDLGAVDAFLRPATSAAQPVDAAAAALLAVLAAEEKENGARGRHQIHVVSPNITHGGKNSNSSELRAPPVLPPGPPPIYTMIMLRAPFDRLVAIANRAKIPKHTFEQTYGRRLAVNTQTSMINGIGPIVSAANENKFRDELYSCASDPTAAAAEARNRLLRVFTVVGVAESYAASMWLAQRAFSWGEKAIIDQLSVPRWRSQAVKTASFDVNGKGLNEPKSYATSIVGGREAPSIFFTVSQVSSTARVFINALELCDLEIHEFAGELVFSRLRALGPLDQVRFKDFEDRLKRETLRKAKREAMRGSGAPPPSAKPKGLQHFGAKGRK